MTQACNTAQVDGTIKICIKLLIQFYNTTEQNL